MAPACLPRAVQYGESLPVANWSDWRGNLPLENTLRDLGRTLNFYLPPECTRVGTRHFRVEILPRHVNPERSYTNNSREFDVTFVATRPLVVRFVPLSFRAGTFCPGDYTPAPPVTVFEPLMQGFREMYPVRSYWTLGSPMDFCWSTPRKDSIWAAYPGWWSIVAQVALANLDLVSSSSGGSLSTPLRIAYGTADAAECSGGHTGCVPGLSLGAFTHWAVAGLSNSSDTAAHETVHSRGYYHESNDHGESGGGVCELWPYPHGSLGEWGINYRGDSFIYSPEVPDPRPWSSGAAPTPVGGFHQHELMSYGPNWKWPSDITWQRLFNRFRSPTDAVDFSFWRWAGGVVAGSDCVAFRAPGFPVMTVQAPTSLRAQAGVVVQDQLLVSGALSGSASASILAMRPVTSTSIVTPSGAITINYGIRLHASDGTVLVEDQVQPMAEQPGDPQGFMITIPYPPEARFVSIITGTHVLTTFVFSTHPPTITLTAPSGGEVLTDTVLLTWEAGDEDGDTLTYDVDYSADGGETWRGVTALLTGASYLADLRYLPGSTTALFRVRASDGINTAESMTDGPVVVPRKAPTAMILKPADGARFGAEDVVTLEGMMLDADEDPPWPGAIFVWASNRQGALGTGDNTNTDVLLPGRHTITLTAADTDGNHASASVEIVVGVEVYLPVVMRGL